MNNNMNSELTMDQMESASGGNVVLVGLAILGVSTGAASFFVKLGKNLADGQGFTEAAHNAGKDANVVGMERG